MEKYDSLYQYSLNNLDKFWRQEGRRLYWIRPYTKVQDSSFEGNVDIRWYYDGTLNAAQNCLDRHLPKRGHKLALIWEGDELHQQRSLK